MLTAGLMLAFKCLSADQARESVEWEVYVCIAFAFAVSAAMEKTKLAFAIAQLFAALGEWLNQMKSCASHIFAAGPEADSWCDHNLLPVTCMCQQACSSQFSSLQDTLGWGRSAVKLDPVCMV